MVLYQLEEEVEKECLNWLATSSDSEEDVNSKRTPMAEYIEKWRVLLWEKAYLSFFTGANVYSKSQPFNSQPGTDMAWKRCLYRYFKRELIPTGVVKSIPPPWFSWTETSNSEFIFTTNQRKMFNLNHLIECCWYIECPKSFVTAEEKAVREMFTKRRDGDDDTHDISDEALPAQDAEPEHDTQVVSTSTGAGDANTKKRKRGAKSASKESHQEPVKKRSRGKKSDPATVEPNGAENGTFSPKIGHAEKPDVSAPQARCPVHELILNESITEWQKANPRMRLKSMPKAFNDMVQWIRSVTPQRVRMKDGKSVRGGGLADLIIIDIPEGLPVPGISDEDEIPDWNSRGDNYLAAVFGFVKLVLQDQGCVIIIHPDDNGEIEDEIRDFHQVVELKSERSWTGINRLLLGSAKISGMTTCFFKVQLLTLSSNNSFEFRPTPEDYKKKSIDIVDRDVILNWVTLEQQTMRKEVPWRGAREKDVLFIESLIRATTDPGDVVVDIGAGTGKSRRFCTCKVTLNRAILSKFETIII